MVVERFPEGQTAVLCSGGLDSVVLLADAARQGPVCAIYVAAGLAWEPAERRALDRVLRTPLFASLGPVVSLDFPMTDVYSPAHWAVRGSPPAYDTPDEDVYLPGRNITLLAKAAIYCAPRGIHRLALGPLAGNPFPDATPEFFDAMGRALSAGLASAVQIVTPLAGLHKADVVQLGDRLGVPLELTLSCMNPADDRHCGRCSKCRERREAFRIARVADPTEYLALPDS